MLPNGVTSDMPSNNDKDEDVNLGKMLSMALMIDGTWIQTCTRPILKCKHIKA